MRVFLVVFSLGFMAWAWNSNPINLRDRIFPRNLATVYPDSLYRSGQIASHLVQPTLERLQIDLVVDLTHDRGDRDAEQLAERRAVDALHIQRVSFPLGGSGQGAIDHYVGAIAEIARAEREGRRVLVHCRAGDRRTSGVIAAYQLLVRGEPAERAHQELGRFARHGDYARLAEFLDANLGEIARGLVQRGVIAGVPDPLPRLTPPPQSDLAMDPPPPAVSGPAIPAGAK